MHHTTNESLTDVTMHRDPSLGTFTALSREIRDQIWECLSVQRRFTIFQTSRQIYTEATQAFYNVQILQFHISPEYQYKSWLTLESNFVTDGSPRLLILQDLNHTLQQGFDKLPFEKLKKIQINIGAPDAADPGQAICLHKKCVDLAALLEHAKHGLPDIEINLVDTSSAKWSSDDKPQRSVSIDPTRHFPYYEFDGKGPCRTSLFWTRFHPENKPSRSLELDPWKSETRNNYEDNEIVLYAFCHLRNARSAKVSGPEQPADYCFNRNVARNLEEEEPFGTYPEPGDVWGDQCIQEDRDKLFMHLDLDLDLLPGPTADMMRLDRFSSWYSSTFGDYGRSSRRLWSLFRRFARMRALNPKSMQRQYKRIQLLDSLTRSKSGQLDRKALDRVDTANMRMWAHELGLIDDEWDQDAWREAWPLGIPAFDSAEFSVAYSQGCDYGISKRVEKYEFRLKRWLEGEDRRPAKRYLDQFHHWPNYRSSHVLDVPDPLKRHQNLPYDLNHPPIDTRATHGIRIKAQ